MTVKPTLSLKMRQTSAHFATTDYAGYTVCIDHNGYFAVRAVSREIKLD
jgi:hypothetical protein